ncbi:hypothetical protein PtrM4_021830 [Pyrenophora tritici-repentis]|uniref:Uncharacterized protein n=1 Tax=Pyrenophora tritici-repentis TaxID=45151 RepID=A0A834VW25_9PLEO|nr:hypothetical protein A1F99_020680 [Pyrenophora tritici-repentis]KAF7577943.1 hypothetical protein PtrM4_021830 [Pyrenophora tritici-repentis]
MDDDEKYNASYLQRKPSGSPGMINVWGCDLEHEESPMI